MAATFTQVAPDDEGDKIAGHSVTRGPDEVVSQEVVIGGARADGGFAAVISGPPTPDDLGLVVRQADVTTTAVGVITDPDIVLGAPSASGVQLSGTPTPGSYVSIPVKAGDNTWRASISGLVQSSLLFYFEASMNSTNGVDGTWVNVACRFEGYAADNFVLRVTTTNGLYTGAIGGYVYLRLRAVGTFTGPADIILSVSRGIHSVAINHPLPVGRHMIGSIRLSADATGTNLNPIQNSAVLGTEYGLVTRNIISEGSTGGSIVSADAVLGFHPTDGTPLVGTPTAGSYVFLAVAPGQSVVDVGVETYAAGSILFEASLTSTNGVDGRWVPLHFNKTGSSNRAYSSSATSVGVYRGVCAGYKYVRVRGAADFGGVSDIRIVTASGTGVVTINEPIPAGTNNIGNVGISSGSVGISSLPALAAGTNNIGDVDVLSLPALPAGNNNIGDVDIVTLPALAPGNNNIGDVDVLTLPALPAGTNNIGDVDVLTLPPLPAGTNNIGDVDVLTLPAIPAGANLIGQTQERPSTLCVTVTAAVNTLTTLTLPAPGASLFIYLTKLEIGMYATAARTGAAAPVVVTTTNLPGTPAFTFETAQAIGTMIRDKHEFESPVRSTTANTAVTVVGPQTANVIWRITAFYYTGP